MVLGSHTLWVMVLPVVLGILPLSTQARERQPSSFERKLAERSPEEQEYLRKIASATSISIEVAVTGLMFDGKKMTFTLRSSTPEGRKFKHRTSKLVFDESDRNPEYEKIFHAIYTSGRPCTLGLNNVTKESYESQFSVVEGTPAGSLNTISGSWLTYVSIGDEPLK
ncbi:MAG: hypothetical protein KA715_06225 [Xanthomonadaceae bacterium]|nr:hypothetical protein [Xanthomonadaceae bacterium]